MKPAIWTVAATAAATLAAPAVCAQDRAASGREADIAALRALVAAQARQIEALSARVAEIERERSAAPSALSAPVAVAAAPAPPIASPPAPRQDEEAGRIDFAEGAPRFVSADERFTVAPLLRLLGDVSASGGSRFRERNITGTQLRLTRLGAEGAVDDIDYRLEIDFAESEVTIRAAYLGHDFETGAGTLRVRAGNLLNDRSLDGATSLTSIPFAERNVVANLIAPQSGSYGVGLFVGLLGETAHVSVNVRGEGDGSNDGTRDDDLTILARGHVAPAVWDKGLLHLGVWGFHEWINNDGALLTEGDVEGSNFNRNVAVLPGIIRDPRRIAAAGAEAAAVIGPVWLAGEVGARRISSRLDGRITQTAWSLSGGWFLTGEAPPLGREDGQWSRPDVADPLTTGGSGAIALLARFDREDQSDAPFGGRGSFLTLGANWYWNDWMGLKLNLIRYDITNPLGDFAGRDRGTTALLRGEVVF